MWVMASTASTTGGAITCTAIVIPSIGAIGIGGIGDITMPIGITGARTVWSTGTHTRTDTAAVFTR